jgi:hypothetical protein
MRKDCFMAKLNKKVVLAYSGGRWLALSDNQAVAATSTKGH